jgi:hypothetical protein
MTIAKKMTAGHGLGATTMLSPHFGQSIVSDQEDLATG